MFCISNLPKLWRHKRSNLSCVVTLVSVAGRTYVPLVPAPHLHVYSGVAVSRGGCFLTVKMVLKNVFYCRNRDSVKQSSSVLADIM